MPNRWARIPIARHVGRFTGDRRAVVLLVVLALFVAGRSWLADHPEHDPWAPLDLRNPPGWATAAKIAALRDDIVACRAVLARSGVPFDVLEPAGEGQCRRTDRTVLSAYPLAGKPPTTCQLAVALELWRDRLDEAASAALGSRVATIEQFGAYSCRRKYGRDSGDWSEHATGNAIDISGFVLQDGSRISVLRDWKGEGTEARFLHAARDAACRSFGITLSPDYNAAHADHLHLDMGARAGGVCR